MSHRLGAWACGLGVSLLLAACGGGDDGASGGSTATAASFPVGGSVSGLAGSVVVADATSGQQFTLQANGAFDFPNPLPAGTSYAVTVLQQPAGQTCEVSNGSGTVRAEVRDLLLVCASVPSLAPSNLALQYSVKSHLLRWQAVPGAQFYMVLEDPDGAGPQPAAPIEQRVMDTSLWVRHSVLLHERLNATYTVSGCNAAGCGPQSAPQQIDVNRAIGYFKATPAEFSAFFGTGVALSADGSTLAVASAQGLSGPRPADPTLVPVGAIHVFTRSGGVWTEQAVLKARNVGTAHDGFGGVAMSADGNTIIGQASQPGSWGAGVYVFERAGAAWSQQSFIPAGGQGNDNFYFALSGDARTMAFGMPGDDGGERGVDAELVGTSTDSGVVLVYVRNGAGWTRQARIKAANADPGDGFGAAVALSHDGGTLAVGAPGEEAGAGGNPADNSVRLAGAAYVFVRSAGNWQQQQYLKPPHVAEATSFGQAVALSKDGSTVAVGAPYESSSARGINGNAADTSAMAAGAAYVFGRAAGAWSFQAYVKASNTGEYDTFGFALSLDERGDTLAVGASQEGSAGVGITSPDQPDNMRATGAAYLFRRTAAGWRQEAFLKATDAELAAGFGQSLALSADGRSLAVGAEYESGTSSGIQGDPSAGRLEWTGAVYLY